MIAVDAASKANLRSKEALGRENFTTTSLRLAGYDVKEALMTQHLATVV